MKEIYKGYELSEDGLLWSRWSEQYLRPTVGTGGYYEFTLREDGKKFKAYLHRMLATAFLPLVDGCDVVNHKDGNKLNNALSNLEWCTHKQNSEHAWETALINNRGSKAKKALWNDEQVIQMRQLYKLGTPQRHLIKVFGGDKASMSQMLNYKTYRDVQ